MSACEYAMLWRSIKKEEEMGAEGSNKLKYFQPGDQCSCPKVVLSYFKVKLKKCCDVFSVLKLRSLRLTKFTYVVVYV